MANAQLSREAGYSLTTVFVNETDLVLSKAIIAFRSRMVTLLYGVQRLWFTAHSQTTSGFQIALKK